MGDHLTGISVAASSRLGQFSILISQLDGQPVQLQHQKNLMLTHEGNQFFYALGLFQ